MRILNFIDHEVFHTYFISTYILCVLVCVYVHVNMCMCEHVCVYVHIFMHMCMCACACMCKCEGDRGTIVHACVQYKSIRKAWGS